MLDDLLTQKIPSFGIEYHVEKIHAIQSAIASLLNSHKQVINSIATRISVTAANVWLIHLDITCS